MIYRKKWITREFVQNHSDWTFVFGDNMSRTGYGGQAKAMRGEPNVIGIPTKWIPTMEEKAFFHNSDFEKLNHFLCSQLAEIQNILAENQIVVFPRDKMGSGLAKLQEKAPLIYNLINDYISALESKFGTKDI